MAGQAQKEYPAIKGLKWHRDQYYSFFVPMDWYQLDWSDDREGVLFIPELDDPQTVFAVYINHFDTPFMPDDLDVLAEGFLESIERLPLARIESFSKKIAGRQLEVEANYTFCEHGAMRRRWVRTFYHSTRQIVMSAQGATLEKYAYWLPIFFETMMTARIHSQKPTLEAFI